MASTLDRIRCSLCLRLPEEAGSTFRIHIPKTERWFFLCDECLALPPEDNVRDIVLEILRR